MSHEKPFIVDLRSDTVTKPTPEMRKAMAAAEVGDDVFGDDPTVINLESYAASLLGKEAALFVPSGTMGNLICALAHCELRGSELIVGSESHMHIYEQGGIATLGSIHSRVVKNQSDGTMDLNEIEACIRPLTDVHQPLTRLVCLENTHNRCGGRVITAEFTDAVGALCKKNGLKLHIDGARIMNAAVALNVPVARLVAAADTVNVCLSKALGAPVGSVIAGTKDFILQARRLRKVLGGGMRQVGILAAAGSIALTQMVETLPADHANARLLSLRINDIDGLLIDPSTVQTNIVYFRINPERIGVDAYFIRDALRAENILCVSIDRLKVRFVTHYDVSREAVIRAAGILEKICEQNRKQ